MRSNSYGNRDERDFGTSISSYWLTNGRLFHVNHGNGWGMRGIQRRRTDVERQCPVPQGGSGNAVGGAKCCGAV